jgi:glycerol-3-phosphate dehydrogenase (NAD(P)+)
MRIAILGAGAWGSALAISLAERHTVALWTRSAAQRERLSRDRTSGYLPQCRLPAAVRIAGDLDDALRASQLTIIATATSGLREVARAVGEMAPAANVLWACKGFEADTGRLPHEIMAECLPGAANAGALSGPSFALEVAQGQPTALVLAADDMAFATATAGALNSARLRIYSSPDVRGVELGGAVKNVIAIAAGICDGLELGLNARAALVTRGLAEIARLGTALGGVPATFSGLAGLGDLVLTCTGSLSRNREVGLRLAAGQTLATILAEIGHVAEGVHSARAVTRLARDRGVEMPISQAVDDVLFTGTNPRDAVQALLSRDPGPES